MDEDIEMIPAGDLGSPHLGRTIVAQYEQGNIRSMVTDVLTGVYHTKDGVRLYFKNSHWMTNGFMFAATDQGLHLPADQAVEVKA